MWMKNGHSSDKMTWLEAWEWADALDYGGFTDWRLPSTYDFTGSQLTYNELKNANPDQLSEFFQLYSFLNLPPDGTQGKKNDFLVSPTFEGLRLGNYWFDTKWANNPNENREAAWIFDFLYGTQCAADIIDITDKQNPHDLGTQAWAIAVRDVPEPASALLFATGLAGTFWSLRRKKLANP